MNPRRSAPTNPVDAASIKLYLPVMRTTVFLNGGLQAVRIPKEFRFESREVSIRSLGDGVVVEPIKSSEWPEGFFEDILITDSGFRREAKSLPAG